MKPVIQLEGISKMYATGSVQVHALRQVSLSILPGEFVAIMGASGSGKSTMMNILGCLDRPTSGRYLLDGIDVSALDRDELADIRNQKIGFVFQGFNLLSRTSALENVELPMIYQRQPLRRKGAAEPRDAGARNRRPRDSADHHPNQLSGGQQQRVAIARALVNEPDCSSPTNPPAISTAAPSVEIMDVFQSLNDHGITIVMVTHELDIARYTKRNIVMRDGGHCRRYPRLRPLRRDGGIAQTRRRTASRATHRMKAGATLRIAARALRRNKMRSLLTMLGIIIGVGAVIAMVGIGNGARAQVEAQIASHWAKHHHHFLRQ